jgi:release factor glutamine methyltransferase
LPTFREALRAGAARLSAAGVTEALNDAALLLSFVTGEAPLSLRADSGRELAAEDAAAYESLLMRRAAREPLQYITGEAPFMGLMLKAVPEVLIPRFDTETLCEQALMRLNGSERVLDLCTGSGALAVAIADRFSSVKVYAGDISPNAVALARENASCCGVDVTVRQGDLFMPFAGEHFDMIVSNPPYIPSGDLPGLMAEVHAEPVLALDGGRDGLNFYRRIIKEAPRYLTASGWLLLEFGDRQAQAVTALLAESFEGITVHSDLNGMERVAAGRLKHGICA